MHLTYQFLIHVLLHVERNSALSLRPYHIEFDTHLESLLFHIFSFVTPSENATLGCPSKQRSPNCQRWCTMQSRICKQNNSDNTDHFLHVLLLKSANTIILKCVSTFSPLSRINELIISEEWTNFILL